MRTSWLESLKEIGHSVDLDVDDQMKIDLKGVHWIHLAQIGTVGGLM